MKGSSGLRPLSDIVGDAAGVLQRLGHSTGELERLRRAWPAILGAELSAHCRPALAEGSRVTVHADAAVWASRLRHLHSTILARIADAGITGIAELRVVVRPFAGNVEGRKREG